MDARNLFEHTADALQVFGYVKTILYNIELKYRQFLNHHNLIRLVQKAPKTVLVIVLLCSKIDMLTKTFLYNVIHQVLLHLITYLLFPTNIFLQSYHRSSTNLIRLIPTHSLITDIIILLFVDVDAYDRQLYVSTQGTKVRMT
jgi:hypothetical protein